MLMIRTLNSISIQSVLENENDIKLKQLVFYIAKLPMEQRTAQQAEMQSYNLYRLHDVCQGVEKISIK